MTLAQETRRARLGAADIADRLGRPAPTPEQVAVIEAPLAPVLVVAGAGSGKTETMAARVVWLVANGLVEPDQVLGLTFTRRAATELADRIARRLRVLRHQRLWTPRPDEEGAEVLGGTATVSTYHSYAGRLVREHALRLGVEPDSRLLTEAAAWQYAAEAVSAYDGPMAEVDKEGSTVTNAVVDLAGELAEHLREPEEVAAYLDDLCARLDALPNGKGGVALARDVVEVLRARRGVLPIVRSYLDLKRSRESLDFADQVALAARLAQRFPAIGAVERKRFGAVLLDEFQDTSEAQLVLLRELFAPAGPDDAVQRVAPFPVTAVGDPHQSIYGWRGASATTLSRFPVEFPDAGGPARVLPLSTSWRNDRIVLDLANRTAAELRELSAVEVEPLRVRPDAAAGRVAVGRYETAEREAQAVASFVASYWFGESEGEPSDDPSAARKVSAAVLCRKRSQFPLLVTALKEAGLPVEVVGLGGLLITPEVADLVALLWVVQDPTRGDHLMRLLTGPSVNLGAADLAGLHARAQELLRRSGAGRSTVADHAEDSADRVSIVEALEELPPADWRDPSGASLSPAATARLRRLSAVVRRLRSLTGLPLADLVGEAERAWGLDVELLARPEHTPATARVHLDAFADVAADFSVAADRPTLGGFLEWLDAALAEERGLDKGTIEVSTDAVQVLTVHAAKGLEWDVVAVPGLVEGTFPARGQKGVQSRLENGRWEVSEATDRAWLGGLDGVPYPMRRDLHGLPRFGWESCVTRAEVTKEIARFDAASGAHGLAEERRLAYVAFTRARAVLLLTAPVWAHQARPRVVGPFLHEVVGDLDDQPATAVALGGGPVAPGGVAVGVLAWDPMPEADAANPSTATPVQLVWPADLMADRRERLAGATRLVREAMDGGVGSGVGPEQGSARGKAASANAVSLGAVPGAHPPPGLPAGSMGELATEIELLLAERDRSHTAGRTAVVLPPHLSASDLVRYADDPSAFALALRRPMPRPPALSARRGTAFHAWVEQRYRRAAILDPSELPGSADPDAADDADLPQVRERFLACEWADRIPVDLELAVETVVDGLAIRGRIDAVFAELGGGWTVVDWKTGARPTGDRARVAALQLAAYRLAYARLRGRPVDEVGAAFYYAATGETVRPHLPGEEGLAALLREIPGPT